MKKAILVGNGVSSQLIPQYKDECMMKIFRLKAPDVYNDINQFLEPFRKLDNKDEGSIVRLLGKMGIESHHYYRYFIQQNLIDELNKDKIIAIETLLKVAHLFNHIRKFDYEDIKAIANQIYFNDGHNGLGSIIDEFDKNKFSGLINEFMSVYTTNFDNILDEAYSREVKHLHGGFYYKREYKNGACFITKRKTIISPEEALLIWGRNENEKTEQKNAGYTYPYGYPRSYGWSEIETYFNELSFGEYSELHIWGYSGLNDGHINARINSNRNLRKIIYYCSPRKVNDHDFRNKITTMFCSEDNCVKINLKSWEEMWVRIRKS